MKKSNKKTMPKPVGVLLMGDPHHRGITLIALIITIIVMLILVAVTVNVALNGGLFTTAKDVATSTQIESDREILQAGVIGAIDENLQIQTSKNLQDNLPSGWKVTGIYSGGPYTATSPNENQFTVSSDGEIKYKEPATGDLAKLQEYFVGKTFGDVTGDIGFVNNDIIPDANTNIIYKSLVSYYTSNDNGCVVMLLEYNNKMYLVTTEIFCDENIENLVFESVELEYEKTGLEGEKVIYSYDGTEENEKEWLILYDYGEYLEIIPPEVMGSLTLGANDVNAEGTTDTEKVINSYNNAIETINSYCKSLITNKNKESVRSLGSNPNNPNSENATKYTSDSDMFKNYYTQYTIESGDFNYKTDYFRLVALNKLPLFNEKCWFASREEPRIETDGYILINYLSETIGPSEYAPSTSLIQCSWTGANYLDAIRNRTYGVCPVVKVRTDSVQVVE